MLSHQKVTLVKLTLEKQGLAGDFDKLFLGSYIVSYHKMFPNERMWVGEKIRGKFKKEVVFAKTSNQVVTTESETRIPDNVVLGSKFIKV